MAGRTVVVLGGGVGGLTAANELRRVLGREHRIVLIDRQGDHLFQPSLLWLMTGDRRAGRISRSLDDLVRSGVEVVRAEVETIDPEGGRVIAAESETRFDALVVALGAELAPEAFPGYAEAAYDFFDRGGAARLASALDGFSGGRVAVAVTALPYKCPAAPYEAALLLEDALRRRGVRQRSEVLVFTPEPQPMPVAGPAMGAAVSRLLADRGIVLHTSRALAAISGTSSELVFVDGTREHFDLLAAVPPHRAPEVVRRSALANEQGWIPVDARTLRTRFDDVYAVGDVTTITLANGKPLPKAGVFASAEALVVAREIAASVDGAPARPFDGKGYCWVEVGGGRAAFAEGDFYASPAPALRLRSPGRFWHLGKVLFESSWIGGRAERAVAGALLRAGAAVAGVRAGA